MNIIFYFAKRSDNYQLIESYISSHDFAYFVGFFQHFLSICIWSYSIPWSNSIFPSNCWLFWYLYKQRQHSASWWKIKGIKILIFTYFELIWSKKFGNFSTTGRKEGSYGIKKRWESRPDDRDVGTVGSYPHKTLPYMEEKSESEFL